MDWENGSVKVVDLNRELKAKLIKAKVNAKQGYVEVGGRKFNVRRPNIDARREDGDMPLLREPDPLLPAQAEPAQRREAEGRGSRLVR
jgi:hypothetical protein